MVRLMAETFLDGTAFCCPLPVFWAFRALRSPAATAIFPAPLPESQSASAEIAGIYSVPLPEAG
jgi:hypothetical protein